MAAHERTRQAIALHFAGRGARGAERALRDHCADCAECRDYYERHLLLSELDPTALGPKDRIGRGLGLSSGRKLPGAAGVFLLAAAALLWFAPHGLPAAQFTARGASPLQTAGLDVYLIQRDGSARPVAARIDANAELAFAYASSAEHPYLMVFGVDEHGHVCWYHPEWTDSKADPVARSVSTRPGTFELPEAITQPLDGRTLQVLGLFSAAPLHVRAVEQVVSTAFAQGKPLGPALSAAFGGSLLVERDLEVSL
jgi:hypothetical protein